MSRHHSDSSIRSPDTIMTDASSSIDWWGCTDDLKALLSIHKFRASESKNKFGSIPKKFDDIRSVPLVIEIPRENKSIPAVMMEGDERVQERWARTMIIYIVMPSPYQVGLAKSLDLPHGQFPLSKLLPALFEYSTNPDAENTQVVFVGSASNYSDSNIFIRNDVWECQLPWQQISDGLKHLRQTRVSNTTRQRICVDIGYTGTQCVGRNGRCELGLSGPRMLVTSRDSRESHDFFSSTYQIDELVNESEASVGLHVDEERRKRWGAKLGNRNIKEAARLHETEWSDSNASICVFHKDGQNGKISHVAFCNRVFQDDNGIWKCQGAVTHFRHSIDDYEKRREEHGPYLLRVRNTFENQLYNRMEQATSILQSTEKLEIADGITVCKIPCNVQVESYYQPFVLCVNRLTRAFNLNELEVTSVMLSMAQSACSAAYALAATEIAIARKKRIVGSDVGWMLLKIVSLLDNSSPKCIKTP